MAYDWRTDTWPHRLVWEDLEGVWIEDSLDVGGYDNAWELAKCVAETFGTGRFRVYSDLYDGMYRDESGTLHVPQLVYDKTSSDYKGVYDDIYGDHPELKGRRTYMPPLEMGYETCLLIEGPSLVIE